jgi:hypothetical protein
MRYRSATVAGFHGLPRCLKLSKERLTAMSFRRVSPPGNARVWAFLAKSCAWTALALTMSPQASRSPLKTGEPALAKNISVNLDMMIYRNLP